MSAAKPRIMRDVLIESVYARMSEDKRIFFLSADFGAPALDKLRAAFPQRFVNVGIAEQNAVNVATGLALEGFAVYVYGISPFISMRPYEQLRVQLSLLAQTRDINVNLVSVGAGMSYDITGPTHHCLEDISIIRTLPNIELFSPSDACLVEAFVERTLAVNRPKYLRLDGKPVRDLYADGAAIDFERGFTELRRGQGLCILATGFMSGVALTVADELAAQGRSIGVLDAYMLNAVDEKQFAAAMRPYATVVTLEEGFIGCGGLDSLCSLLIERCGLRVAQRRLGLSHRFCFESGGRARLHQINGIDPESVKRAVLDSLAQQGRSQ